MTEENGCILTEPVIGNEKNKQDISLTKWNYQTLNPFIHKLSIDSIYEYFKVSIFLFLLFISFIINKVESSIRYIYNEYLFSKKNYIAVWY